VKEEACVEVDLDDLGGFGGQSLDRAEPGDKQLDDSGPSRIFGPLESM
jgi:hypothetical protein